ncbi:hypothetical protein FOA52_001134 [Chlamydomonas sp. UWO 241]|nr:hypothetical protein FOA52_001134 [Chlamydomonas sp. UWO 241]
MQAQMKRTVAAAGGYRGTIPMRISTHAPCSRRPIVAVSSTARDVEVSKRSALLSLLASSAALSIGEGMMPAPASAGIAAIGDLYPASAVEGLVTYVPNSQKTPAIRAGIIREPYYSVLAPANYTEAKLANILTGNFCMPNCGEPWTEVAFEAPGSRVALLVLPLVKLTNERDATITSLGSPEQLLPRIGNFITGTVFEADEDLVSCSSAVIDGRAYYYYELFSLAGNGHSVSAVTTKGEGLYLLVASASDKAWKVAEQKLRVAATGFRA